MFEEALADSVVDTVVDLREENVKIFFKRMKTKRKSCNKFQADFVPGKLGHLEKIASENGHEGFFCGSQITWADLYFVVYFDLLSSMLPDDILNKFPKVNAIYNSTKADQRVAKYYANRPETEF